MNSDARFGFLPGRGEMAQRIRKVDWAGTSLGDPEHWPQNLRSALSLCLSSRFPILIWWGEDMRVLYNDAYIPFLGSSKHPEALGQPGQQCWSEIWSTIGPMLEGVYRTGEATWSYDAQYFFDRDLPREEVYVTFTYGPILADDGVTVEGVFCPCTETTEKIVSARRLETLRKLGVRPLETRSITAASENVSAVLAENRHDVPFAVIYRCCADGTDFEFLAATGVDAALARDPAPWRLAEVVRAGEPANVDLRALGLELPGGPWPESAAWARVVPMRWSGDASVSGVMVLGVSSRRPLDAAYCSFLDLVAGHAGSAVANAVAYEQEKRRAEALAEIDRAKTTFFSNASHEFRTPLTLILGPLEDAINEHEGHLPPDQARMLHRNALRLQKLVNTLLDFSRIEAGRIHASYEPTDLAQATAELASVFRSAVETAGMKLLVRCAPLDEPVYVDRDMYEKIVLNLVSNAFKFTLDGEIEVALRDAGNAVELCVRDTGTGIAAEHLPHIFERFHRIEGGGARTHEGTGIGLALVQELARLHGGEVAVRSTLGQGSTFTVAFPKGKAHLPAERIGAARELASSALAGRHYLEEALRWLPSGSADGGRWAEPGEAHAASPSRLPAPAASDARARIVCADDNADMRDYIERLLAPLYDVEMAPDGDTALACVLRQPPALVIADIMMPGLDGLGLLRELRADERTRVVPVILLSARAGQEARVEGMQAGADDYLTKPFSARELLARVDAHLRLARLREEANAALRENEKHLRTIIEQLPAGVGVTDMSGAWVLSNSTMQRYVPKAIPSTLPDRIAHWRGWDEQGNLIPPENWPGKRALRGEMVAPGLEMLYTDDAGRECWLRVSAAPLRNDDGEVIGACSVMQDITQLKRAEQDLKEADRRKDEFLATLAHELRNPLAPIRNGLHVLRLTDGGSEDTTRVHEMLERQVGHMVRLVDDLLEVSRITRGKIQLRKEPVELGAVVRNAVETSQAIIDGAGHRLTITLPAERIMLDADPVRLAQVVSNLLNNAAKYTDEGGRISLTAYREGGNAVVSVRDNGVGIPTAMLPKVFDLFTQVDSTYNRAQGGLGIGLTLVRSLVEMHEGSVEAASAGPGQGSEFLVRIPVPAHRPGTMDLDGQAHSLPTAALGRILIVDDNRDAAESIAVILRLLGAEVEVARDGREALAMLGHFRPQVMLLDIGMPGMDGFEVARRVRADPGCGHVTLIAMTGWGQEEDLRRSREAGIDHHMVKPVEIKALEQLLAELARQRHKELSRASAPASGQRRARAPEPVQIPQPMPQRPAEADGRPPIQPDGERYL